MLSEYIRSELDAVRSAGLLREPPVVQRVHGPFVTIDGRELLTFCSNDYLGIGQDPRLGDAAGRALRDFGWGAGSARTLSGTTRWHDALEEKIAEFKGAPAALLFSSGYTANIGLITTIAADPKTMIISDELNHASVIDGCLLSHATSRGIYSHRDVQGARAFLEKAGGRAFIVTDAVFSMDGDLAPLA